MSRYLQNKPKRPAPPDYLMPVVITALIVAIIGGYFVVEWIKKISSTPEYVVETNSNAAVTITNPYPRELSLAMNGERQINPLNSGVTSANPAQLTQSTAGLPNLLDSDVLVRQEMGKISPGLLNWLGADQLIRRYLLIVNDFAQSQRIASHMSFIRMEEPFLVEMNGNDLFMSAKSYQRYDRLAQAVQAVDTKTAIRFYTQVRPLMLQVFKEFGYHNDISLEATLKKAVAQILAVPALDGPLGLIRPSMYYKFADAKLEALNPVQKQMLRMGPVNLRNIQAKLREFLAALAKAEIK